ncbi:putative mediator of RNA polymerase II transcription subunit 26b [Ananas comosus]|uniref:Putative mediator of RNA polymerase II transcription subunit 26b n=1 Tax=Ananas comosus TaxID=4615 RepID=A0A199UUI2_ANACO|nr:putative mediator of RNA polymerase II transcription subunit 26b [Ananas comosus]
MAAVAVPASPADSLDYWRKFFRSAADADIFRVIEKAIAVAAADSPDELRARRARIAEALYVCLACTCSTRRRLHNHHNQEEEADQKEEDEEEEDDRRVGSNLSYDEAEALTEEIEEESHTLGEVLRIKGVLSAGREQSDGVLFESLRRLQLMELSVQTLQATEIGKAVNGLKRHNSKQIRHLVRTLIEEWKVLVDEWISATAAIADISPDSMNPSTLDEEEGLPFPPLDEGALLATQTTTIQLSKFFDEMDDDGNFSNHVEASDKRENESRAQVMRQTKKQEAPNGQAKPQCIANKPIMPRKAEFELRRAPKVASEQKALKLASEQKAAFGESRFKKPQDSSTVQRKQPMVPTDKSKLSEEASVRAKLELAKRKLHEGYQQAENAKKQRTIQVMELQDIPKQAHQNRVQQNRQPNVKPKNHIRSWANGRR